MAESDTYVSGPSEDIGSNSFSAGTGTFQPPHRSKIEMPELNLENAQKIIQFYQTEPQWLANPRTRHAAEADFGQASKIIGMSLQIENANAKAEAARAKNSIAGRVGQSLLKLAETGEVGAGIAAKWYALGDDGKPLYENPANASKIFEDYKTHTAKESSSLSNLGKLLKERASASEEDRAQYDRVIGHIGEKMGVSMQQDDQGRWIVNYGPQQGTVGTASVATQSQAQQKLLRYEAASELINHVQKNMESGHIGLSGVLGEYVGDKLLPQLGVDTFKGKRADVRSTLIAAREALMREISNDTKFSIPDREEITRALPSSGIFESLPDAMQKLTTVRNILNARGKTYSSGIGLPTPEWSLSPEEIKAQYEKHEATGGKEGMSFEKAKSLLERFHHFQP